MSLTAFGTNIGDKLPSNRNLKSIAPRKKINGYLCVGYQVPYKNKGYHVNLTMSIFERKDKLYQTNGNLFFIFQCLPLGINCCLP